MNEAAKNALEIYREKVASGEIEAKPRRSLEEKFKEKPTLRSAVNLFCHQCIGGDLCSNWRKEVKNCQAKDCPLYQFRPGA